MKRRHPPPSVENETTLLHFKEAHEALAAAATEKLRRMHAAEEMLDRVRELSEGAGRPKPPLPKPAPVLPPTEFVDPYEDAT